MNKIVLKKTPLSIAKKKTIKINSKQNNTKHIQNKQSKIKK
jgi:hypothetical protein